MLDGWVRECRDESRLELADLLLVILAGRGELWGWCEGCEEERERAEAGWGG